MSISFLLYNVGSFQQETVQCLTQWFKRTKDFITLICLWLILPYLLIRLSLKTQLKSNLSDPGIQVRFGNEFDSLIVTRLLHIVPQGILDAVRKSSVTVHLKLQNCLSVFWGSLTLHWSFIRILKKKEKKRKKWC